MSSPPQYPLPVLVPYYPQGPPLQYPPQPAQYQPTQYQPGQYQPGQFNYPPQPGNYMPQPGSYMPQPARTDGGYSKAESPAKPSEKRSWKRLPEKQLNFDEYKREAVPAIKIAKLRKVQALVRGWYTRKFIVPWKRIVHTLGYRISQSLLSEFLADRLIPEIILDVIDTSQSVKDYGLYSTEWQIMLTIADELQETLIKAECEQVVKDINKAIVNEYMRTRVEKKFAEGLHDPLMRVVYAYVDEVVVQWCNTTVKESVNEMIDDYLADANATRLLRDEFVPIILAEIVNEACWAVAIEDYLFDCFEVAIDFHISDVISAATEFEKLRLEKDALSEAFETFIARCILRSALEEALRMDEDLRVDSSIPDHSRVEGQELDEFAMDVSQPYLIVSDSRKIGTTKKISPIINREFTKSVIEQEIGKLAATKPKLSNRDQQASYIKVQPVNPESQSSFPEFLLDESDIAKESFK